MIVDQYNDGSATDARFHNPVGIIVSNNGNELFITEYSS